MILCLGSLPGLGYAQSPAPAKVCDAALADDAASDVWAREDRLLAAIRSGREDQLHSLRCVLRDEQSGVVEEILDLRGLKVRELRVAANSGALSGALIRDAQIGTLRILGGLHTKLRIEDSTVDSLIVIGAALPEWRLSNVTVGRGGLLLRDAVVDGAIARRLRAPAAIIEKSALQFKYATEVVLSEARIRSSRVEATYISDLGMFGADLDEVQLALAEADSLNFRMLSRANVRFIRGKVAHLALEGTNGAQMKFSETRLDRPILAGFEVENSGLRDVSWETFTTGDDEAIAANEIGGPEHSDIPEERHQYIESLYRRLAAYYRTLQMNDVATGFQYEGLRFHRKHLASGVEKYFMYFQESLDGYQTSSRQLRRTALLSWFVVMLLFVIIELMQRVRGGAELSVRAVASAVSAGIAIGTLSMAQFATRPFQLDGLISLRDRLSTASPWKRGLVNIVGAWGLFLAVRSLPFLASRG